MRYFIEGTESIILNIQAVHAARIYSGRKTFELRKVIPSSSPEIVFLFEQNGEKAITGAFIVKKIHKLPIDVLWKVVGSKATTKERFYNYFDGYEFGNAYEIDEVIKFENPVYYNEIIDLTPSFRHPQSFVYLRTYPELKKKLFLELNKASLLGGVEITFSKPSEEEEAQFKQIALEEISKKYDEIDKSFVDNIVKCSKKGFDPNGYFTSRKILYSIKLSKKTIGYIVVTEKIGNSVKTGPTILLPEYRNKGFGREARNQIEEIYKEHGFRKLYCTCNATDCSVIRYLIKSGMKVEAHLSNHYKAGNSEFIFGKLLRSNVKAYPKIIRQKTSASSITTYSKSDEFKLTDFLTKNFKYYYFDIDDEFVRKVLRATSTKIGLYSKKNKIVFTSQADNGDILTIAICSPKRGGAIKINFLTETSDKSSFNSFFEQIIKYFRALNRTKIYTTIPIFDLTITKYFEDKGFTKEGTLIEPYMDGIDMYLLSFPLQEVSKT